MGLVGVGFLFTALIGYINIWLITFAVLSTFVRRISFGPRLLIAMVSPVVVLGIIAVGPWDGLSAFFVAAGWSVWLSLPAGVLVARWSFVSPAFTGSIALRVFVLLPVLVYMVCMVVVGVIALGVVLGRG